MCFQFVGLQFGMAVSGLLAALCRYLVPEAVVWNVTNVLLQLQTGKWKRFPNPFFSF